MNPGPRISMPTPRWLKTGDGLVLRADQYGDDRAPTIAFGHGFGQTRHAWSATAQHLATAGYRCMTADGRGHGESGWVPGGGYALDQFVADVHTLAATSDIPPVWVGASMGGLLGMIAAAESETALFRALILVDITPRWETRGVERILVFMRAHPNGFASVEEAQAAVKSYLPHRAGNQDPQRLHKLLVPTAGGRLRWHWDPALLDTVAEETERWSERLHAGARRLRLPVLLISGGRSDVVSDQTIGEFKQLVPQAELARIEDATHMVVGDANDRFSATIADYLARIAQDRERST